MGEIMAKRHWTKADFTVTATTPAYDGSRAVNRFGYCRKCKADMQSFGGEGKDGPILHYKSHQTARQLGIW